MKCIPTDEIVRYLDRELSGNRTHELEHHFQQCRHCERRRDALDQLTHSLVVTDEEFVDPALAGDILARARAGEVVTIRREHGRARRWYLSSAIAASVAAAAVTLLILFWNSSATHPVEQREHFMARGEPQANPDEWIALWPFRRVAETTRYEPLQRTIQADDRLVFGYLNAQGHYQYLMIWAMDNEGTVYWYYPAYERPGTDPVSIAIQPGRHELQAEIQHDFPPGSLRIFAVFSRTPLHVLRVEALLQQLLKQRRRITTMDRLPIRDTGQFSRLFEVTGPIIPK